MRPEEILRDRKPVSANYFQVNLTSSKIEYQINLNLITPVYKKYVNNEALFSEPKIPETNS